MSMTEQRLSDLLDKLRWVIPALIAALGIGYTLFEHLLILPHPTILTHLLGEALVLGAIGPAVALVLLT